MTNIYQGDPKLSLGSGGSYLTFKGGQPVMDKGLENMVMIKLFTRSNWPGNILLDNGIGSDFEIAFEQPITVSALNNIRNETLKALNDPAFGDIEVTVTNPESYRVNVFITIAPPGQDILELLVTKNGLNWVSQKLDPAYKRI